MIKFKEVSQKQFEIFLFGFEPQYDMLICDGAVRSGKTLFISISFVYWAMENFNDCKFAICSKTIDSAKRNILDPLLKIKSLQDMYDMSFNRSSNELTVKSGNVENVFHVFGGKDERSQDLIQGITLSGVMLDEVVLMPRSFVDQALARMLTESRSKTWISCNPGTPDHWFYKHYIKDLDKRTKYLHFLMTDNPANNDESLRKAEKFYKSGVFRDRYILGKWVRAEGLIYPLFANANDKYIFDDHEKLLKKLNTRLQAVYIGVDFGHNKSKNCFECTGITKGFKEVIALDEHYIKEDVDTNELAKQFVEFADKCIKKYHMPIKSYHDNAEAMILRTIRHAAMDAGLQCSVAGCYKHEIIDRIALTDNLLSSKRLYVSKDCENLIDALNTAVWDDKNKKDGVRLDDGSTKIDPIDAHEYSICKIVNKIEKAGFIL